MSSTPLTEGRGWTRRHTIEELNSCAIAAQAGDEDAKERLVFMMRPYLVNFLRKIPGDYTRDQRDEMTAAALIGLWEGLKRYDHETYPHVKFSNYALNWVRHEVTEWRSKNSRALPVPRKAWNFARKLEIEWEAINGPEAEITQATDAQLHDLTISVVRKGEHVGIQVPYAGDIVRGMRQPYLLDADLGHDGAVQSAEDVYMGAPDAEEEEMLAKVNLVADALLELPARERLAAAESFCEELGWPPEAAEILLEMRQL